MRAELQTEKVAKAYGRWAPVYDLVFGPVFERGRRAAIDAAERVGGRILEVGVGTGISLPEYASATRVFGVDISGADAAQGARAVEELGLTHVEGLAVMDAERLDFPDDSFDVVVAQYVVTAVPNPGSCARRVRPRRAAGRRDRADEPRRRRARHAAQDRALAPAGRAAPRLADRVRMGALRALGRPFARRAAGRAATAAAARAFLADPVRQEDRAAALPLVAGASLHAHRGPRLDPAL